MTSDIDIGIAELEAEPIAEVIEAPAKEAPENLAEQLSEMQLTDIGMIVYREYEIDETNFASRKRRIEELYKLALQVAEEKTYPWAKASNIKYPLITDAALAFSAIAYPSIVKDDTVVKAKIVGKDDGDEPVKGPDGQPMLDDSGEEIRKNKGLKEAISKRVGTFMSHQILNGMDNWEEDMDKILLINPIIGCSFKKTYYDPVERKNVSKLVLPQYLIMDINGGGRSSELINLYPHEIDENIRAGIFRDFDYSQSDETKEDNYIDSSGEREYVTVDESKPHLFIEQHRRLDLDEDGYQEPYKVWLHKESKEIVRIIPLFEDEDIISDDSGIIKINGHKEYTKFGFIPDPEGSPYDIGFGHLLEDLNNAINSSVNQMIDQGHRYTMGGGFIGDGLRIKSGEMRHKPGEYKRVKTKGMSIRENVVPLPMAEPSGTLMLLIEGLIKAAKEISAMSDVRAGDMPANTPAVTAMANMEQGMQPFKAIFKRIHRSLKQEFKALHKLNQLYLTDAEYQNILDDDDASVKLDFNTGAVDIIPMSDPEMLTNTQSFMKAQLYVSLLNDPFMDPLEIRERMFKNLNEKDIDDLIKAPQPQGPDVVVESQVALLQAQMVDMKTRNQREDKKFLLDVEKQVTQSKKDLSQVTLNLAKALELEDAADIAKHQQALEIEQFNLDRLTQLKQETGNESKGMGQVEGTATDGGVL